MTPTFTITAFDPKKNARIVLFTWCRDAESGIRRAIKEAPDFGQAHLTGFKAEPVS